MSTERVDALVIGAGHNGLVAGAYLARAGLTVTILERCADVGGMAGTADIEPGFRVSTCAHSLSQFSPQIIRDLDLQRHGFATAKQALATTALNGEGRALSLDRGCRLGQGLTAPDALDLEALAPFMRRMRHFAQALAPALISDPQADGDGKVASLSHRMLRRLDASAARDMLALATARVSDLLDRTFDDDVLKGALAFDALRGTGAGPRAPGTVLPWLYRLAGEEPEGTRVPLGGMGGLAAALRAAALAHGARLLTGAGVSTILTEAGRAAGVRLDDGTELMAPLVLSSLDPVTTYLSLVGERVLPVDTVRRVNRWRAKGITAKVNLSLDGLPGFRGLDETALRGRLLLAPPLGALDAAYRPAKHGRLAPALGLEVMLPSLLDPTLAPQGGHVLSAVVEAVPYVGETDNIRLREEVRAAVIARLAEASPDLPGLVRQAQVLTPRDFETQFGAPGGHWHHGALALDQLWSNRPAPGMPDSVPGLVLCGAGSHPGGGVTGLPGLLAARRVLTFAEAA